jgi:hypothetical protein
MASERKQNLTVSLSPQTVQKATILAARHSMSISDFLALQIEALVNQDEVYERAHRTALDLMEPGFHLGGGRVLTRREIHDR